MDSPSSKYELIYSTRQEKENRLTVKELCEMAGVSRSGYYNWCKQKTAREDREAQDKADFALILEVYRYRGYDKGARGIHMRLIRMGVLMNVTRIWLKRSGNGAMRELLQHQIEMEVMQNEQLRFAKPLESVAERTAGG